MFPPIGTGQTRPDAKDAKDDGGRGVDRRRLAVRGMLVAAGAALVSQLIVVGAVPRVLGAIEPESYVLPYRATDAQPSNVLAREAFVLLNQARAAVGLAPLERQDALDAIARGYACALFAAGFLSHVSPDGGGPRARLLAAGVQADVLGENLAYAASVPDAHDALMASLPHRENILYAGYRRLGIGVADGARKGVVVVEDFASDVRLSRRPPAPETELLVGPTIP